MSFVAVLGSCAELTPCSYHSEKSGRETDFSIHLPRVLPCLALLCAASWKHSRYRPPSECVSAWGRAFFRSAPGQWSREHRLLFPLGSGHQVPASEAWLRSSSLTVWIALGQAPSGMMFPMKNHFHPYSGSA